MAFFGVLVADILITAGITAIPLSLELLPDAERVPKEKAGVRIAAGGVEFGDTNGHTGGDLPTITLYDHLAHQIGPSIDEKDTTISDGGSVSREYETDQQPTYIRISASSDDPLCVSWLTVLAPDGRDFLFWNGDYGKACDYVPWYPSPTRFPGSATFSPACVWIAQDSDDYPVGFSARLPDFRFPEEAQAAAQGDAFKRFPDSLCRAPARQQFWKTWGQCIPYYAEAPGRIEELNLTDANMFEVMHSHVFNCLNPGDPWNEDAEVHPERVRLPSPEVPDDFPGKDQVGGQLIYAPVESLGLPIAPPGQSVTPLDTDGPDALNRACFGEPWCDFGRDAQGGQGGFIPAESAGLAVTGTLPTVAQRPTPTADPSGDGDPDLGNFFGDGAGGDTEATPDDGLPNIRPGEEEGPDEITGDDEEIDVNTDGESGSGEVLEDVEDGESDARLLPEDTDEDELPETDAVGDNVEDGASDTEALPKDIIEDESPAADTAEEDIPGSTTGAPVQTAEAPSVVSAEETPDASEGISPIASALAKQLPPQQLQQKARRSASDAEEGLQNKPHQGGLRKSSHKCIDHLVISEQTAHSAREVCNSPSSWGPDFVSIAERVYCDLCEKQSWPLCDGGARRGGGRLEKQACFDLETRSLKVRSRDGRLVARGGLQKEYVHVQTWR